MLGATKKQSIGTKKKQDTLMAEEEGKEKEMDSAYSYMCIFHSPINKTKVRRVDLKFYAYQDRAFVSFTLFLILIVVLSSLFWFIVCWKS